MSRSEQHSWMLDDYIIEGPLGQGRISFVNHAWKLPDTTCLAIKRFLPDPDIAQTYRVQALDCFRREANFLSQHSHEHILPYFDYGTPDDDHEYMVVEYAGQKSLQDILWQQQGLSARHILHYVEQISAALDYLHPNYVHCHLTPGNILISDDNHVWLAGFGYVYMRHEDDRESHIEKQRFNQWVNGATYLSPEIIKENDIDERSDIYTLGLIIYQMFSGTPPFEGDEGTIRRKQIYDQLPSLHAQNPDLPYALDQVLRRATAKEPYERYGSARELYYALQAVIGWWEPAIEGDEPLALDETYTVQSTGQRSFITLNFFLITTLVIMALLPGVPMVVNAMNTPTEQAKHTVQQFYDDINGHHYREAYQLLGANLQKTITYDTFARGFAHTRHDDIIINATSERSDGNVEISITIRALENLGQGTVVSTYRWHGVLGQQHGAWKILNAQGSKITFYSNERHQPFPKWERLMS